MKPLLPLFLAALLIPSCSKSPELPPPFFHAASKAQADLRVIAWCTTNEHAWTIPDDTAHSMAPLITRANYVLLKKYHGERLFPKQVIVFDRGDNPHVMHEVEDENENAVYVSGIHNHESDGWIQKTKVTFVVTEIIEFPQS